MMADTGHPTAGAGGRTDLATGDTGTAGVKATGLFSEAEPGRKGEILEAALDVFAENGYDGGSMREIASRVGVSEPALYRHFSGKEALFLALVRVGAGRVRAETMRLLDSVSTDDLRGQMLHAIADRRSALHFYAPMLRVILPAAARHERVLDEYRAQIVHPMRARLADKAAEIDTALGVPDADASRDARVRALLSLMVGYMVSSFVIGDERDEAIVDAALRVMDWDTRV